MTSKGSREEIVLGFPWYGDVDSLVWEDSFKFAYYLGRRCIDYDFAIAPRFKTEQYRARNAIVEEFIKRDSDYLLMLDDDHIIGINGGNYGFPTRLVEHLKARPEIGAIGGFYLQRRDSCSPVLLNESKEVKGAYAPLLHLEISGGLQKVDIIGGGCMLFPKRIFDRIPSPWFEPESSAGWSTDIQICRKIVQEGFEIWADTSIHLGHLRRDRQVITMETASLLIKEGSL